MFQDQDQDFVAQDKDQDQDSGSRLKLNDKDVVIKKTKKNKNLCGRDGRTICGPLCVPKSTDISWPISENRSFSILDVRS